MHGELIMPNLHQDQSKRSIHTGTNYLPSNKKSAEMSWRHRGLSFEIKSDTCQVLVSNLSIRNDQYREKTLEVNQQEKVLSCEKNINIIDHGNTMTVSHLNLKDNEILAEMFTEAVSTILH